LGRASRRGREKLRYGGAVDFTAKIRRHERGEFLDGTSPFVVWSHEHQPGGVTSGRHHQRTRAVYA
jgi:hypothetical protein